MQVSLPIRIVALVGLLGALSMGAWMYTAGRTATSSVSDNGETAQPVAAAKSAADKLNAHAKATAAGKPDAVAPARGVKPAVTKPAPTPRPAAPKIADGTPITIAGALRTHKVVVVLLWDPQSKVDGLSVDEARSGAKQAGAGFLRVNVLRNRQVAPFAKPPFDVERAPTVLFFVRPGTVVQKLVGFADRATVTQAALNAARRAAAPQG